MHETPWGTEQYETPTRRSDYPHLMRKFATLERPEEVDPAYGGYLWQGPDEHTGTWREAFEGKEDDGSDHSVLIIRGPGQYQFIHEQMDSFMETLRKVNIRHQVVGDGKSSITDGDIGEAMEYLSKNSKVITAVYAGEPWFDRCGRYSVRTTSDRSIPLDNPKATTQLDYLLTQASKLGITPHVLVTTTNGSQAVRHLEKSSEDMCCPPGTTMTGLTHPTGYNGDSGDAHEAAIFLKTLSAAVETNASEGKASSALLGPAIHRTAQEARESNLSSKGRSGVQPSFHEMPDSTRNV